MHADDPVYAEKEKRKRYFRSAARIAEYVLWQRLHSILLHHISLLLSSLSLSLIHC